MIVPSGASEGAARPGCPQSCLEPFPRGGFTERGFGIFGREILGCFVALRFGVFGFDSLGDPADFLDRMVDFDDTPGLFIDFFDPLET